MSERKRFSEPLLAEILSRTSLSALIGASIPLTRHGREYEALCPFHTEKSPSFNVVEKGDGSFFHCFGCGANGNAFDWLLRWRNLSFPEAVEQLACDAGITIPPLAPLSEEDRRDEARRATLLEAVEAAAVHYQRELGAEHGAQARAYLAERGISAETIERFRIGWARPGGSLRFSLDRARYPDDLLIEAGLKRMTDDGRAVDLMRGRVILPIGDARGRIVGFGGRTLGDDKPKYLNSPASEIFDKRSMLYGLSLAREASARTRRLVFMEGYFDVISSHQAGVTDAVAPLGTALTDEHLRLAWRLCDEPVVCMDGDRAGLAAMDRAADRALDQVVIGKGLAFAKLPIGKDPDDLIGDGGKIELEEVLAGAIPLSDAVFDAVVARHPVRGSAELWASVELDLYRAASRIPDVILRRQMLGAWRSRLRLRGIEQPEIYIGRSTKNTAPLAGDERFSDVWEHAVERALGAQVREWLALKGIDWDRLVAAIGGVGQANVKFVKGKMSWSIAPDHPPVDLWEGLGETSVLLFPEWEGGVGGTLLDLVAWDPRADTLATRTGHTIVLGEAAICEARGFEARGLAHPVRVADGALAWLRRRAAGENCVLIVDWRRAWDALGGCKALLADTYELGELLEQGIKPPAVRRPAIKVRV